MGGASQPASRKTCMKVIIVLMKLVTTNNTVHSVVNYSKCMGIIILGTYLFCALEVLGTSVFFFLAISFPPPPFSLPQSSSFSLNCSSSSSSSFALFVSYH